MSKRETVSIKVERVSTLANANGWSEAAFSRKIGKHSRWLSEVRRNRNLPSPEEAARMCAILQVSPEDILVEPYDIQLVRGLIEEQKEKADSQMGTDFKPTKEDWERAIDKMSQDERRIVMDILMKKFVEGGS